MQPPQKKKKKKYHTKYWGKINTGHTEGKKHKNENKML